MSFSELRSMGPRLPPGKLSLPEAIDWVGRRVVTGWDGTERDAAAHADEGIAVANHFEPMPEPLSTGNAVCAICGKPATRMRASRPYCSRHGKRQPIPRKVQELLASERQKIPPSTGDLSALDEETLAPPDASALFRWAKAHAALRQKVLAGELRPAVREPGGKIVSLSAEEWCAEGFPAADEARARLRSRGQIPMHVIFDAAELEPAFASENHSPGRDPLDRARPGRPSMRPRIMQEMERRAARRHGGGEAWPAWHKEAGDLAEWAKRNCGQQTPPKASAIEREMRQYYKKLSASQDRGN